jgi:excisionase family DNA binding protein
MPETTPSVVSPSDILTTEELAQRLKVPLSYIYEKQRPKHKNPIPTMKIGRYLRFDWAEVSAWLKSTSTAAPKSRRG